MIDLGMSVNEQRTFGSVFLVVDSLLDHEFIEIATEGVDHQRLWEFSVVARDGLDDLAEIGDQVAVRQSNGWILFCPTVTRGYSVSRYERSCLQKIKKLPVELKKISKRTADQMIILFYL
jgi:hypothetical protein